MKTVDYKSGILTLKFLGDDFSTCLDFVKNLPGAVFVPSARVWVLPAHDLTVKKLKENNWTFTESSLVLLNKDEEKEMAVEIDEKKLDGLFPFQLDGVRWLEKTKGIGIIGDEMGLGKTIQAIGYAKLHQEKRPVVVICPASVKLSWQKEIEKWTGELVEVLYGKTPYFPDVIPKWFVINYDILSGWIDFLLSIKVKIIVADESQMIANNSTIRTKAVKEIRKKLSEASFIGLSGTPIRNRPSEFFTILNLLSPNLFPNRYKYLHRYCDPCFNGFGWTYNGATNIDELHELIKPLMIRRLKSEVLKDLPPKIKSIVPLELEAIEKDNYMDAEGEFRDWLDGHKDSFIAQQKELEKLKQLAYLAKRNSMMQWIEDFLSSGEKLVVMAYHTMAVNDIYAKFSKIAVKFDGSVSSIERQTAIDKFQNDPNAKLFVGQIIAAGVGITLTAASNLAFAEFTVVPADHAQAEDRIHRIGQKESVNIYYLAADGTVENRLVEMLVGKYDVVKKVVDGYSEEFIRKDQTNLLVKELCEQYTRAKI